MYRNWYWPVSHKGFIGQRVCEQAKLSLWAGLAPRQLAGDSHCPSISVFPVSGDHSEEVPPDLIPNSEVKLLSADGT